MGSTDVILNCLTVFPSVTEIIFDIVLSTVNYTSHLRHVSRYTRNGAPGLIEYFVAGAIFDVTTF